MVEIFRSIFDRDKIDTTIFSLDINKILVLIEKFSIYELLIYGVLNI